MTKASTKKEAAQDKAEATVLKSAETAAATDVAEVTGVQTQDGHGATVIKEGKNVLDANTKELSATMNENDGIETKKDEQIAERQLAETSKLKASIADPAPYLAPGEQPKVTDPTSTPKSADKFDKILELLGDLKGRLDKIEERNETPGEATPNPDYKSAGTGVNVHEGPTDAIVRVRYGTSDGEVLKSQY